MKAADLSMIQHCAEHGSFRVLPLRTCEDLARLDMDRAVVHSWATIGHASTDAEANGKMKAAKLALKESRRISKSEQGILKDGAE